MGGQTYASVAWLATWWSMRLRAGWLGSGLGGRCALRTSAARATGAAACATCSAACTTWAPRGATATSSTQDIKGPPWILLRARPKFHEALWGRNHQFYIANRLVLKIGCRPRAPPAKTSPQTYRFAYAKPLLLSGTGTFKNLQSAESSKQ